MAHRSLGLPPAAPVRWPGFTWLRGQSAGILPWLLARLLDERERWMLWLPVGIGLGIGASISAWPRSRRSGSVH